MAEVLQLALHRGPEPVGDDLPEAALVREREYALRNSKLRTLATLGTFAVGGIALACIMRNNHPGSATTRICQAFVLRQLALEVVRSVGKLVGYRRFRWYKSYLLAQFTDYISSVEVYNERHPLLLAPKTMHPVKEAV